MTTSSISYTDLGEDLVIADYPRCYRHGSPEERARIRAWIDDNFGDNARQVGPDIWFLDRTALALYLIHWQGL